MFRLRVRTGFACIAMLVVSAAAAVAQSIITDIAVSGAERLPPAAIVAASGIRVGEEFSKTALDGGAQHLADTGLFAEISYRYDPAKGAKPGYLVTLQVKELPVRVAVRLDIPGTDEQQLWSEFAKANGLLQKRIPAGSEAEAYYRRAIQEELRKRGTVGEIVVKTEADPGSREMVAVFRPANVPKMGTVRFTGNQTLKATQIEPVMNKLAAGRDYSEHDVRQLVELNVRPLFEEQGLLTVTFPAVSFEAGDGGVVNVTVSVVEGPAWTLGTAVFGGEGVPAEEMSKAAHFPLGKLANWKQMRDCIENAELVLKHNGYLAEHATAARTFEQASHIVDVEVQVKRGQQFVFGELMLSGLMPADLEKAQKLWQLSAGTPMDEPYKDDYLRAVVKAVKGIHSVNAELKRRPNTNVIDVAIAFK